MLTCKHCAAVLDLTMSTCPSCGAEIPLARLAGLLGLVCRSCDAYNDAGTRTCVNCGQPLGGQRKEPPAAAGVAAAASIPRSIARLLVERGEAQPGTAFAVSAEELQVGRGGEVNFPDPCLAPRHATFLLRDKALLVRDEGAPGGIYLRLRGLTVPLRPGALFALGDRLLRFAGPLPPPPPPSADGTHRLGTPRPDRPAVVVEEWLEGAVGGRAYLRVGPSITIGRAGCSINLGEDPYLSQAHAEVIVEADGSARLRDLGSSSGTFVRLPPGSERELRDGDLVRVGREVLRVEMA
ncbi:MAG TPA: FHA domain-containing protein [Anaeromyxobacteraceae bacterium]|nr:FHA domain-containing protein [Anaeromyxobacteraceae bacterium]